MEHACESAAPFDCVCRCLYILFNMLRSMYLWLGCASCELVLGRVVGQLGCLRGLVVGLMRRYCRRVLHEAHCTTLINGWGD